MKSNDWECKNIYRYCNLELSCLSVIVFECPADPDLGWYEWMLYYDTGSGFEIIDSGADVNIKSAKLQAMTAFNAEELKIIKSIEEKQAQ